MSDYSRGEGTGDEWTTQSRTWTAQVATLETEEGDP